MRKPVGDGKMVEGNSKPPPTSNSCLRNGRVNHTVGEPLEDVDPIRDPYTGRIGMTKKKITWEDGTPSAYDLIVPSPP